ncbi:MAG: TonB-dependent receptor [Prevotellaceae bacterium]|jgi:outer membrane receptor protein involved in Fe transport|nr:TonB-dependent receptor [Prevotellaceae bacterium]
MKNYIKSFYKNKRAFWWFVGLSVAKKTVILAVALLCGNSIFAQTTIKGKVLDFQSKNPIEFVTVAVKGQKTNFFNGAAVDAKGAFAIENLPKDTFLLTASFLGYDNFEQKIIVDNSRKIIELKPIFLKENAHSLQEVQVTGMQSQMRFELDRKVFSVDANIASAGGSASEILQNIPSVEVTNEGEISLRGSTSVVIWINGKESGLTSDNQASILEQLPAETIERVEIITNPSAKYSPEGTAGIINIVLKENRKAGYYGSVQAGMDSRLGYNASGSINYSSNKVEGFASVGFRSRVRKRGGYSNRIFKDDFNDSIGFLNQNNYSQGRNNNIFTRLGVTYHATKKDHISLSGFGMFGGRKEYANVFTQQSFPQNLQNFRRTDGERYMSGGNVQLGYKHDFDKEHYLDLTATYNIWGMKNRSDFSQFDTVFSTYNTIINGKDTVLDTTIYRNSFQRQTQDVLNHLFNFKADYSNNINAHSKVEAGAEVTLQFDNSPVQTFSGSSIFDTTVTPSLCNTFLYNRNTYALYSTYSGKYGNFNFQVGLRGEVWNTNIKSFEYGQNAQTTTPYKSLDWSLFPSVFLSYQLPKDNQLQVNYTRRIRRPWGGQLNAFKNITDSTNISFGNPYLNPEYSNALELNYIKMWKNHTISFSGYFRNTENVMQRISYLQDNLMYSTQNNVAKSISTGAEFVVKNSFWKMLNLTTTLNLYYYQIDAWKYAVPAVNDTVFGQKQASLSWNVRMIVALMLPKGFSLQVTGGYNAPQATAQGRTKGSYSIDAGLRKTLKSFSFSLNARDIFNSRARSSITEGKGFSLDSYNWWGGRTFSLTVTYNFGNMKRDLRKERQQQNGEEQQQGIDGSDFGGE